MKSQNLSAFQLQVLGAVHDLERPTVFDVMSAVYPRDQHPRAWRSSVAGGPPGGLRAISRTLNVLTKQGLIWREPCPGSSLAGRVQITATGRQVYTTQKEAV